MNISLSALALIAFPSLLWAGPSDLSNIKELGAVGDGVHDDTAAIVAASKSGASVFFPPGTYRYTATIQINVAGLKWTGAGRGVTVLAPDSELVDGIVLGDEKNTSSEITFTGLSFRQNKSDKKSKIIQVKNSSHFYIYDFDIDGGYSAIDIDNLSLQSGVKMRDFLISNTIGPAIDIGSVSDKFNPNEVFIRDGSISNCGIGLSIEKGDGIYIDTLSIYKSNDAGVYIRPGHHQAVTDVLLSNVITDSSVTSDGWRLTSSGGFLGNIYITNTLSASNAGSGLSVQPSAVVDGLYITGGTFQNNGESGIAITSTSAHAVSISGVQAVYNSIRSSGSYSGIAISPNVSDFSVRDSFLGAYGLFAPAGKTNQQAYGIELQSPSGKGFSVEKNRTSGNLKGGVKPAEVGDPGHLIDGNP